MNPSDFSIGRAHKFLSALRNFGFSTEEIEHLSGNPLLLEHLLGVTRGTHEIQPKRFPLWRTVRLGVYKSEQESRDALGGETRHHDEHGIHAVRMLAQTRFSQHESDIRLAVVGLRGLGLTGEPSIPDIFERASIFGLRPCPHEAAVAIRMQYRDQPLQERLVVATEPLDTSDDSHVAPESLFYVVHYTGGLYLWATQFTDSDLASRRWIFLLDDDTPEDWPPAPAFDDRWWSSSGHRANSSKVSLPLAFAFVSAFSRAGGTPTDAQQLSESWEALDLLLAAARGWIQFRHA